MSLDAGISKALLNWYDYNARILPWREEPTPYRVWVSEIMLQQTRVEAVKPYYERFLQTLPTIKDLAEADEETILNSLRKTKACVVLENHNLVGGLYSAVSELLCEKLPMKVEKIGIKDRFGEVGKMPYLKEVMGMTTEDIISAIRRAISNK